MWDTCQEAGTAVMGRQDGMLSKTKAVAGKMKVGAQNGEVGKD